MADIEFYNSLIKNIQTQHCLPDKETKVYDSFCDSMRKNKIIRSQGYFGGKPCVTISVLNT